MPAQPTTLIQEMASAARGTFALLRGDRRAAGYFDLSQRGLIGSFIALLAAQVFSAYGPILLGATPEPGVITRALIMVVVLFTAQVGFSAIVLRQIGRLDGLMPYLVADNWATFFITIAVTILAELGLSGDFALLGIAIVVIIVEINIARLIVTLSALQIGMFLIAQLVGVSAGLLFVGLFFPALSPPV